MKGTSELRLCKPWLITVRKMGVLILPTVFTCAFISCQKGVSIKDYEKKYNTIKKQLSYKIERNGMVAEVRYIPNELYVVRNMVNDTSLSVKETESKYKNSLFLMLRVWKKQGEKGCNLFNRQGLVEEIECNEIKIYLYKDKDTVAVSSCRIEPKVNTEKSKIVSFVFPRNKIKELPSTYNIVLRNIAPEIGTVEFKLKRIIKKTPKLRVKNEKY